MTISFAKSVEGSANAQNVHLGEPFDFERRQGVRVEDLDDDNLSPALGERLRALRMDVLLAALQLILAECLSTIRHLKSNTDRVRKLSPAAGMIPASIRLA